MTSKAGRLGGRPIGSLLGGPVDTKAYPRYARENVERSRNLFKGGDVRYAAFSANEALELCAKAYLLHYKMTTRAAQSGHLPYPRLVEKLGELLEPLGGIDPACDALADLIRARLDELGAFFAEPMDEETRVALWKWSLGARPGPRDHDHFGRIEQVVLRSIVPPPGPRAGSLPPCPCGAAEEGPGGRIAGILGLFHKRATERKSLLPAAPWSCEGESVGELLRRGKLAACLELLFYAPDMAAGYAHQQISRYPTPIDGADSGELYLRHRDAVGRLLERLHGASGMLMGHLDASSAPALRSSAALRRLGVLHA